MGKNQHSKDRLFVTQTEWKRDYGGKKDEKTRGYRKLPYNCCALTFQPTQAPVCTPDGAIFDIANIIPYLKQYKVNPITGDKMSTKELIKINFFTNSEGKHHCPVMYKTFNDYTHIVAIKTSGNVYCYEAVKELNVKAKNWTDLITGESFKKKDIMTIQDPKDLKGRDIDKFFHLSEEAGDAKSSNWRNQNTTIRANSATQRILDKVSANEEKRQTKITSTIKGISVSKAHNTNGKGLKSRYTTGAASSSFTSTSVEVATVSEYLNASEDEINDLRWKRMRTLKKKGYARIETNFGNVNIELHCDIVPCTTENFIKLANKGYYDGLKFHRNIKNFMIQGGDPTGTGKGGDSIWGKPFKDEFDSRLLHSGRGILSMANSGPKSNRSQFFITYKSCGHLNNKHSVFGRVVGGMEALSVIENIKTDSKDKPVEEIIIKSISVFVNPFDELEELMEEELTGTSAKKEAEEREAAELLAHKKKRQELMKPKSGGVGRYISKAVDSRLSPAVKTATTTVSNDESTKKRKIADEEDTTVISMPPPAKKIAKVSKTSFGNFDGW